MQGSEEAVFRRAEACGGLEQHCVRGSIAEVQVRLGALEGRAAPVLRTSGDRRRYLGGPLYWGAPQHRHTPPSLAQVRVNSGEHWYDGVTVLRQSRSCARATGGGGHTAKTTQDRGRMHKHMIFVWDKWGHASLMFGTSTDKSPWSLAQAGDQALLRGGGGSFWL